MPDLLLAVLLLVAGAVLLTAGSEAFAEHVTRAAARLGVSVLALGVLLAGAEPEEAVTAMLASGQGHPSLAAGDPIGANLVVLTLTLGLAALLTGLPVTRRVVSYAVAAALAGVFPVALAWDGSLDRVEGGVLVLVYVLGVGWVWRREKAPPSLGEMGEPGGAEEHTGGGSGRAVLLVLAGVAGMVLGGYLAVEGADRLVGALGLSESVVGLTILALATSAEMLALVWAAHRRGVTEVVLAGAVGAVAYNATVSVGLGAVVSPLDLGGGSSIVRVGVLTAVLPLVVLLGRRSGVLPRPVGAVLVAAYAVSVAVLFTT